MLLSISLHSSSPSGISDVCRPNQIFTVFSILICFVTKSCLTLCDAMDFSMAGFPILNYLLEFARTQSVESVMLSNHLILCHPLLFLPLILHSIRVFSNGLPLPIRWPKYWSFSISSSNEHSGLISFRIDWFDLLVIQGTPKSLLQGHSSKVSTLRHLAFFIVQLSHLNNGFKFIPSTLYPVSLSAF